ncbi:hypothetical protein ACTNEW_01115 [Blautia sp. HCP3S3_G3]|uniref:hypothetical protein n=1 Tax=Blautia sp. HCP3S3_G3 TaxID=3438913 RepID=UPI003F8A0467
MNKKHKDRLFRKIFEKKEDLLSLYNALNGSDYTAPEELEIYTMDSFVYMGMRNDLSFLIDMTLNVYEHQSTYNPNMPLRGFFYMSSAYQKYVALNKLDIYSSKRIPLPLPKYYVFYNGTRKMPDESTLFLTDSMPGTDAAEKSSAQFAAHMINVNAGHNSGIMKKCPKLYQYSLFIEEIRMNQKKKMALKEAVEQAVDSCIKKGILTDILLGNKAEVTDMILEEYDENLHISNEKEISYQEGLEQGRKEEQENTLREKQRADQASQQAKEASQQAKEANQRAAVFQLKLQGKTEKEIAEAMNLPFERVQEILNFK